MGKQILTAWLSWILCFLQNNSNLEAQYGVFYWEIPEPELFSSIVQESGAGNPTPHASLGIGIIIFLLIDWKTQTENNKKRIDWISNESPKSYLQIQAALKLK